MFQYGEIKLGNENELDEGSNIVPRSLPTHDDADDDVKLEIETMMALHGIRMEDEVSDEALQSLIDIPEKICKDELGECDSEHTTVRKAKKFCCCFLSFDGVLPVDEASVETPASRDRPGLVKWR